MVTFSHDKTKKVIRYNLLLFPGFNMTNGQNLKNYNSKENSKTFLRLHSPSPIFVVSCFNSL